MKMNKSMKTILPLAAFATPFLPLSDLSNNVLRDTPQKANS
jgi:hypothetical protein